MLYAWGLVGTKGDPLIPVKKHVDGAGHCIYPSPVVLPTSSAVKKVTADMSVFAVLTVAGEVFCWGSSPFSSKPTLVATSCVDCDVTSKGVVVLDDHGALHGIGPVLSRTSSASFAAPLPTAIGSTRDGHPFVGVSACGQCLVSWTASGEMYSLGCGLTNGHGADVKELTRVEDVPPFAKVVVGSRHAAALTADGQLYTWGDGLSGTLGHGSRLSCKKPTLVSSFVEHGLVVVDVGCTRGQADPKRNGTSAKCVAGQEGPRCHAITSDGRLWIAGTSHKGMGGDHLYKTMEPDADLLHFYAVGGDAADTKSKTKCFTGGAEDIQDESMSSVVANRLGLADTSCFGKDGKTNYLSATKIIQSTPGHIHSLAVGEDGRLFAWGCGSDGRMGLKAFMRGPNGSKRTLKCYVSSPSAIEELEGRRVLSAAVGRYWSLAVVQK